MTPETIPINPTTRAVLLDLSTRTGQPVSELLDAAVEALRKSLAGVAPVASIPGVDPAQVWESAAQEEAGRLVLHEDVFAKLRARK